MQQNPAKKTLLQKQIPTILGLIVLVVALISGIFFVGQGTGVFAPRATPQTTPKNIKLTNVTDSSFTVSFLTDEATAGFVKYGTEAKKFNSQSSDDRDQLTGTVGEFQLHHITVRGLQPGSTYYYVLGTGTRSTFDNNGSSFSVTTARRGGAPSAAKTAYGSILTESGSPAEGSVVYVSLDGVGEMSSLVKASGSWAVPLSNARNADGSGYATIGDNDPISITVQGPRVTQRGQFTTTVSQTQPVGTFTFGQSPDFANQNLLDGSESTLSGDSTASGSLGQATPASSESGNLGSTGSASGSSVVGGITSGGLGSLLEETSGFVATTSTAIDLEAGDDQRVATSSPKISGKAAPNVTVTITVNSETQITQELVANENGEFELDLEALKAQLEPGEHTATYSYTDPNTGQVVTKTVNFTVEDPNAGSQTAQSSSPSPTPFGSGNPYSLGGSSSSSSGTSSSSASPSPSSSSSGRTSTPSTSSGIPVSGSVGTTFALVFGGLFFIVAGIWSYWLAQELEEVEA